MSFRDKEHPHCMQKSVLGREFCCVERNDHLRDSLICPCHTSFGDAKHLHNLIYQMDTQSISRDTSLSTAEKAFSLLLHFVIGGGGGGGSGLFVRQGSVLLLGNSKTHKFQCFKEKKNPW